MRFHVWFATKRRKWLLLGEVADVVEDAIREAAQAHRIRLLESKTAVDHAHLLVDLDSPDRLPVAMKLLKGRSARTVLQEIETLKMDAGTSNLWQRGYGWKLVLPSAERTTRRYIRTQMDRLEKFER